MTKHPLHDAVPLLIDIVVHKHKILLQPWSAALKQSRKTFAQNIQKGMVHVKRSIDSMHYCSEIEWNWYRMWKCYTFDSQTLYIEEWRQWNGYSNIRDVLEISLENACIKCKVLLPQKQSFSTEFIHHKSVTHLHDQSQSLQRVAGYFGTLYVGNLRVAWQTS